MDREACNAADRLVRTLEWILEEVSRVQSATASKRTLHKVAAFFLNHYYSAALKKCVDNLDWAMTLFNVSSSGELGQVSSTR